MKKLNLLFLLLFLGTSFVFAQFDDEILGGEEETADEICVPENIKTGWDSLANKELQQDIRMLYSFGVEYYKNKSYKEALPYLWKVYLFGDDRYAKNSIRKITDIYFNQGMVDSTLIACYRGLEKFPTEKILHHYAGLLQNKLGKFRCAIPHFEALVSQDSENKDYIKTLAFLYFKNEDDRAIEMQERVVALSPGNAEEANTLATYVSAIRGSGADLEFRKKAYDQAPENIDFALSYGSAAADAGQYKKALAPLKKVLKQKPSARVYKIRAEVYENLNQNTNAINDYKSILKLEPGNINVMLRITENYRNVHSFSKARFWVNKALAKKPGYGAAYISMGEIYEASVSYCTEKRGGKPKYEDKLVYELAAKEYKKAQKDPGFRSKAKTKYNNVFPFIPTKEDVFMHKGATIKSECYTSWIK